MKKFLALLLMTALLLPVCAMADEADTFTSASVADYYGHAALTGPDLMNAVNSQSGCYLVSTTNPDGSPNTAYFVFAIKKVDEKYYLQLGLAENQSKANLLANGAGLAVYAARLLPISSTRKRLAPALCSMRLWKFARSANFICSKNRWSASGFSVYREGKGWPVR